MTGQDDSILRIDDEVMKDVFISPADKMGIEGDDRVTVRAERRVDGPIFIQPGNREIGIGGGRVHAIA